MFEVQRVYNNRNLKTGLLEWFFSAREGVFGPYADKGVANKELDAFIKSCIKQGDDGGRKFGKNPVKLSIEPMHDIPNKRKE